MINCKILNDSTDCRQMLSPIHIQANMLNVLAHRYTLSFALTHVAQESKCITIINPCVSSLNSLTFGEGICLLPFLLLLFVT